MEQDRGQLSVLEARLRDLEKRQSRMRFAWIALAGAIGAFVLMGQATARSRTIDAEAFALFDDSGKERAQLSVSKDGAVALLLKNRDGVADANLAVLQDGSINLRMRNPRKSAVFEIASDGTAALRINEKYAKSTLELGIDASGTPRIVMTDPSGKAVYKAP
jgi:hypothetical protein